MREPTIHLAPVTQTHEGNEFFVGVTVDDELTRVSNEMVAVHVKCARSVFLDPLTNLTTGQPGIGVYVHDHHGGTILSNLIEDVPIFGELTIHFN